MSNKINIPKKYDIIHGAFFDRNETLDIKNKLPLYKDKYHYMLVIASFEKYNLIEVILGTSTKYSKYEYKFKDNDLIVQPNKIKNGLIKETLFSINCSTIGVIENTSDYLIIPKGRSTAIVGSLEKKDIEEYERIKNKYPQILNISKYILSNDLQMLPSKLYKDNKYKLPNTEVYIKK